MNPLQLRKELLVAESNLNRARLIEECQAMTGGFRTLSTRVKSVSALASATALLVAGVSAFRRERASADGPKPSWLQMAVQGAELAGSLWLAFRTRQR